MRVDVKTCSSLIAWTCAAAIAPHPTSLSPEGRGSNCLYLGGDAWWPEGLGRPPGLVNSDRKLFRDPEAGGPGAGVGGHLLVRGPHGLTGDDAEGGPVAAGADWLLGWADAVF